MKVNEIKYFLKANAKPICQWNDFLELTHKYTKDVEWIFRGQSLFEWDLTTSIERRADELGITKSKLPDIENRLLRKFKRQFRHYAQHIPDDDRFDEWFSIMQHYGAPTRMLDFTYSMPIALFFAIENAEKDKEACIWCINNNWLKEKFKKNAPRKYKKAVKKDPLGKSASVSKTLFTVNKDFVHAINPYNLNERLSIQQGVFVIPLNLENNFMCNMASVFESPEEVENVELIKINCSDIFLKDAYYGLNRMNITRASLFPGLEGFSAYLKMLMLLPEIVAAENKKGERR